MFFVDSVAKDPQNFNKKVATESTQRHGNDLNGIQQWKAH